MINTVDRLFSAYGGHTHEDRPLRGYAGLVAVFNALVGGEIVAARLLQARTLERLSPGDIVLLALATHKLSRLITKDAVTSIIRAPFTTFESNAGDGEVQEGARGTGIQHAMGEVLTCPFCFGQWILTVLVFGLFVKPGVTRVLAGACAALTGADFLHVAYGIARKYAD
ncbi:MAG: DUF1360 domain-containing protein [Chloroflexi bacterium]|nr:DUF1360 domain-containing protein [Chloroflexota bacterium]